MTKCKRCGVTMNIPRSHAELCYDCSYTCCFCGKDVEGYGNNPAPLVAIGVCCNDCNISKVIPERLKGVKNEKI